jgi:hypothetical protein
MVVSAQARTSDLMLEILLWRRTYERIAEAIRDLLHAAGNL